MTIFANLFPYEEDILALAGSAGHQELCPDAAHVGDEEAAVGLRPEERSMFRAVVTWGDISGGV